MSKIIICPYCFKKFADDKVHFRSEYFSDGENPLPEDYDSLENYIRHLKDEANEKYGNKTESDTSSKAKFIDDYLGQDEVLKKALEWELFKPKEDEKYKLFWSRFEVSTEEDPTDDILKIKSYERPVINPYDKNYQGFLRKQKDDSYLIKEENDEDFVSSIELFNGQICDRRVCPECHNPLPQNYGKTPVKFVTVVGISGAGKTVYLSKLLESMNIYAAKVGLSAKVNSPSITNFHKKNPVAKDIPLPESTPVKALQQPLFYEIIYGDGDDKKVVNTFVMYDVAGEVCTNNLIKNYAPFINNADGVILLIDPIQLSVMKQYDQIDQLSDPPEKVMDVIYDSIHEGSMSSTVDKPVAISISKCDKLKGVIDNSLLTLIMEEIKGVTGQNGFNKREFNAKKYNPIGQGLNDFFVSFDDTKTLAQTMYNNFSNYAWFALSALGGVDVGENEDGKQAPLYEPDPRRIEEPILWLFNKFGYIGENAPIYDPKHPLPVLTCPDCGKEDVEVFEDIRERKDIIEVKKILSKKQEIKIVEYNCECRSCGYIWLRED